MKNRQTKQRMILLGAVSLATVLGVIPGLSAAAATSDTIDASKTGTISIYKYDITAAEKNGAYTQGTYEATGMEDSRVETALEGYEIEGVEFSYMKVGDAEACYSGDAEKTEAMLVYELPKELAQILGLDEAAAINRSENGTGECQHPGTLHYTSNQISEAMSVLFQTDDIAAKNKLESYLKDSGQAAVMPETNEEGYTGVSGLPLGLYLIAETAVPEDVTSTVDPWFVQLPFTNVSGDSWVYDMTCYPKNQTGIPNLEKKVRSVDDTEETLYRDTATASEGDILNYMLLSKLPHITSASTFLAEYTFADTLSAGLEYNQDVVIYFYHTEEDARENRKDQADAVWSADSGMFSAEYSQADTGSKLKIAMTEQGLEELNKKSDLYIVADYTAELTSSAEVILGDEGNPNDVQLTWKRTSENYFNTLEDRSYVYSYGLILNKSFSDNKGNYENVNFNIYNSTDAYYVVAERISDGVYNITGKAAEESGATTFIPDSSNGKLLVNGFEADEYQITETATDTGYKLLADAIDFSITSTDRDITPSAVCIRGAYAETSDGTLSENTDMYVGPVKSATAVVEGSTQEMQISEGSANAMVAMNVINTPGFKLPQTGGAGTFALPIIGVFAAFGGTVVFMKSGKKNA